MHFRPAIIIWRPQYSIMIFLSPGISGLNHISVTTAVLAREMSKQTVPCFEGSRLPSRWDVLFGSRHPISSGCCWEGSAPGNAPDCSVSLVSIDDFTLPTAQCSLTPAVDES